VCTYEGATQCHIPQNGYPNVNLRSTDPDVNSKRRTLAVEAPHDKLQLIKLN